MTSERLKGKIRVGNVEEGLKVLEENMEDMRLSPSIRSILYMIFSRKLSENLACLDELIIQLEAEPIDVFIKKYKSDSNSPELPTDSGILDEPSSSRVGQNGLGGSRPSVFTKPGIRRSVSTSNFPVVTGGGNISQSLQDKIRAMKEAISHSLADNKSFPIVAELSNSAEKPTINENTGKLDTGDSMEEDRPSVIPSARAERIDDIFNQAGGITREQLRSFGTESDKK